MDRREKGERHIKWRKLLEDKTKQGNCGSERALESEKEGRKSPGALEQIRMHAKTSQRNSPALRGFKALEHICAKKVKGGRKLSSIGRV